jgi:hypothetical protein
MFCLDQEQMLLLPLITIFLILLIESNLTLIIINVAFLILYTFTNLFESRFYLDQWLILSLSLCFLGYNVVKNLKRNYEDQCVNLSKLENYIYKRDYFLHFSKKNFKTFFDLATIKTCNNLKYLSKQGDPFDSIIFLARVPEFSEIKLENKDVALSYLRQGSWLGIVEFVLHISSKCENWLISCSITDEQNSNKIIYYEWDKTSLTNLFEYSYDYELINSILSIWIKYIVSTVSSLDDHVSAALKAMEGDDEAQATVQPLCMNNILINNFN